jgi:hypothetical protein
MSHPARKRTRDGCREGPPRVSGSLGSVLLFVRLVRRSEQAAEGEVLRSVSGRASNPRVRGPVAHPAHDDLDVTLSGGRPKLVGAALRTPIRRVHATRVRLNLLRGENPAAFRSHVRLGPGPGNPGCCIPAGWPSGLGRGLQSPAHRFDSGPRLEGCGSIRSLGRLAQGESASLTRKRSEVQIL